MKTLLKNARILKMDDSPIIDGSIVVDGNRIVYIGTEYDKFGPFDAIRDCHHNLLMPSFKDAHAHGAMTFLRSKADDDTLHDWLFNVVFPREAVLKEEDVYHLSKVAFLEYLSSGISASFEQYYFPYMSAKAAEEMGFRVLLLGTYNKDLYGQDTVRKLYHDYNYQKDGLVKYCLGMHAEYTADEKEFKIMSELVHELKAPFYTHICETQGEVDTCFKNRGMSPVEYFDSWGMFDYGGGCYHCIYMSDKDIEIFKEHNLNAVTCPGSNAKLASGIAPIKKYLNEGLNIALGTDGPASNNCLDMFKEMMLVNHLAKLINHDPLVFSAYECLKMATVNASKAMGYQDIDILEVGKVADIIEIDLSRPNMQPINNIISNIVYSGSKDNINMTMVNGKILYADRKFYLNESIEDIYHNCQIVTERIDEESK